MNVFKNTTYSAVRQTDVYSPTTEPAESLSPTQAVFQRYLGGRFDNKNKWVVTTMVCGLCAITLGSILVAVNPYEIIFRQVHQYQIVVESDDVVEVVNEIQKVTFFPDSEEYKAWETPQVKLYLKVYLFNVTNREAYMSGEDKKLKFQEAGPYVYRELMSHGNASFNENGTISAIPLHPLIFVPELSAGTEEDMLVLPNIALLGFAHVMRDASLFSRMAVNVLIKNTRTKPLVEMTAKEFMFGYKSTLVTIGNKFLPSWIAFDKLGLIDRMYNFEGDTSTFFSGQKDIKRSGLIDNYNNLPYLANWPAPCNNVSYASDGTKFPSRITKEQELLFFRKSLCRSMPLVRTGEEFVGGIHAYRYVFKNYSLDNGEFLSENKCFCKESCLPRGILDVRDCYYGFPIALSYPHFLDTDQRILDAVEGVLPNREKHHTYFVVNEESGLPLNVSVKMQINMALGDLSKISNSEKFSNLVLPMLWMEITMPGLPSWMNSKYYMYLTAGPLAQKVGTYLLLICGMAFVLLSLASAVLIPRMNLVSSNRTPPPAEADWRAGQLPPGKKRNPPAPPNKEMDMYYCSLLAVPSEDA